MLSPSCSSGLISLSMKSSILARKSTRSWGSEKSTLRSCPAATVRLRSSVRWCRGTRRAERSTASSIIRPSSSTNTPPSACSASARIRSARGDLVGGRGETALITGTCSGWIAWTAPKPAARQLGTTVDSKRVEVVDVARRPGRAGRRDRRRRRRRPPGMRSDHSTAPGTSSPRPRSAARSTSPIASVRTPSPAAIAVTSVIACGALDEGDRARRAGPAAWRSAMHVGGDFGTITPASDADAGERVRGRRGPGRRR